MSEPNRPLSHGERKQLAECEQVIKSGLHAADAGFKAAGRALADIDTGRLYRASYRTFADYCLSAWNFTADRAYQLIGAAKCRQIVGNEGQARQLAKMPPDDQEAVVAVAKADGQPLTAAKLTSSKAWLEEQTAGLTGKEKAQRQADLINEAEAAARYDKPKPRKPRDRKAEAVELHASLERTLNRLAKVISGEPDIDGEAWQSEAAALIQAGIDRGREIVKAAG